VAVPIHVCRAAAKSGSSFALSRSSAVTTWGSSADATIAAGRPACRRERAIKLARPSHDAVTTDWAPPPTAPPSAATTRARTVLGSNGASTFDACKPRRLLRSLLYFSCGVISGRRPWRGR
jgi:hypothetical protein